GCLLSSGREILGAAFRNFDLRIVAGEADVVRERVEPDIRDEILVERQLDPPIEPRFWTRDAKISSEPLNRVPQFCLAKIRNDRVMSRACGIDVSEQPVLMLAQFEIIIFFLAKLDLAPLRAKLAVRPAFLVSQKLFLANRVVTRLFVFINLSGIEKPLQH